MDQLLPNMEQITYNDCKETLHMDTYLENNQKKQPVMRKDFMNPTLCGFRISLNMKYLNVCNRSQLISANFCLPTFFLYSVLCQMTLLWLVDLYLFIPWKLRRKWAVPGWGCPLQWPLCSGVLEFNITELETFRTLSLIQNYTGSMKKPPMNITRFAACKKKS